MAQAVTRWRSTDGSEYDTQELALAADKRYEMVTGFEKLVADHVPYHDGKGLVMNFLLEHEVEVRRLINIPSNGRALLASPGTPIKTS